MIGNQFDPEGALVIGWKLDEARAALSQDESTRALPIRVIETIAPLKKVDAEIERFGDWRVLRSCIAEDEVELIVAREQIVD